MRRWYRLGDHSLPPELVAFRSDSPPRHCFGQALLSHSTQAPVAYSAQLSLHCQMNAMFPSVPLRKRAANRPTLGWRRRTARLSRRLRDRNRFLASQNRIGLRADSCLYCKVRISGAFCPACGNGASFAQRQTPGLRFCALQMLPLRLLITAAVLCHLLAAPTLVTSQLLPAAASDQALPTAPQGRQVPVTIRAIQQEKNGPLYTLKGKVQIDYGTYIFFADQASYNEDTGEIEGEGHLLLEGGPNSEHIEAARARYNLQTESGRFEDATGSVGFRLRSRHNVFTTTNPFFFSGRVVEKSGPDHYMVIDGTVTTYELPRPKWQFAAGRVNVEVGGRASIYHSNFRIEGVPILYFPFATHPVQKTPRQTGFLIPSIGRSSVRGNTAGEAFFWAINRSMDLLAGTEYYSKHGWAPEGEFRAQPTDNSYVDLTYFSV